MIFLKKNIKEEKRKIGFDDLPADKKRKIIRHAVRKSNEDQLNLVRKYEKIYGRD